LIYDFILDMAARFLIVLVFL